MAKLPDKSALAGPASFRSGRVIASYDVSGIGAGLQSLGNDLASIGLEQKRNTLALEGTAADGNALRDLHDLERTFDEASDFDAFPKRAEEGIRQIRDKWSANITDPQARQLWSADFDKNALAARNRILGLGEKRVRESKLVSAKNGLEGYQSVIADPDAAEDQRAAALQSANASIEVLQKEGLLSPSEADDWRSKVIEGGQFVYGQRLVERKGSAALNTGDYADRVIGVESGGNRYAKNPNSSATGPGQFIASTWAQFIRERHPELLAGGEIQKHRTNPALSREAVEWYAEKNAAELRSAGLPVTDGTLYLAHFAGPDGAKKILHANPDASAESVLGSAVVSANPFLKGMSAADVAAWADKKMGSRPAWFQNLPPQDQYRLEVQAGNRDREIANELAAQSRAMLSLAVTNAPAAILNTGGYAGEMPTERQFITAYGPQEGPGRYADFQSSVETSRAAYDMRTMPTNDIRAMLDASVPRSTGNDAALETKRYETLSQAAKIAITARNSDPSAYVQQVFPHVAGAWAAYSGGTGSFQQALAATAAAQQHLGIEELRLLPKDIADSAVEKFKDVDLAEAQRIEAVAGMLMSTSDKGQRQAIFEQLVEAGLPDITEGAFEAMARGDSGAARRLFQAAIIDPSKLPGKSPETQATIDEYIQSEIMEPGQIGDVYYGLSNGSAENFVRAERDAKLISHAVNLRLRNGESLANAVASVSKDLYGDVKVVEGDRRVNAQIVLPSDADEEPVLEALASELPKVREELSRAVAIEDAPADDGGRAVMQAATENYVDNVLSEGFFRNAAGGFVFIDPYTGLAVADETGIPIVFSGQLPAKPEAAAVSGDGGRERALDAFLEGPEPLPGARRATPQAPAAKPEISVERIEEVVSPAADDVFSGAMP
jgi:hypothetical protein